MKVPTFLNNLNPNQLAAVIHSGSPLLIIAGPGTGKTRTLIAKLAYLLETKKVNTDEILALTFTDKASREMHDRLSNLIKVKNLPGIKTFHALAYQLLQHQNPELISFERQQQILKELINTQQFLDLDKTYSLKELTNLVGLIKTSQTNFDTRLLEFTQAYDSRLKSENLLDFDDLIIQAIKRLKDKPFQIKKFSHIFIDEFQDTTPLQFELARLLLSKDGVICAIGDPFQSIYSFRGADSTIFELFRSISSNTKLITLTENYRNCSEVLTCARSLFPNGYKLQPKNNTKGLVKLINTPNEFSEAQFIVRIITELIGGGDLNQAGKLQHTPHKDNKFSDFAVIYRTHHLSRNVARALRESGFPFQVVGGGSIYERIEIDFIIRFFRFLYSPDSQNLLAIINHRYLKLPEKALENIKVTQSWPDLLSQIRTERLNTKQESNLENILKFTQLLTKQQKVSLSKISKQIITYFELNLGSDSAIEKVQDLQEFVGSLLRFDKFDKPLEEFFRFYEALLNNDFYDANSEKITLLTMHAAKGLEFKYVFIIGFEEGFIPFIKVSSPEKASPTTFEEEKRLFYVALTRAEKLIWLMRTERRFKRKSKISPFAEILQEYIQNEVDPAIITIEKRKARLKAKRSQLNLFKI